MTPLSQQSQCRPASFVRHCGRCGQPTRVCACGVQWQEPHEGGVKPVFLPTTPGVVEVRTQRKIGDRVFVVADNYGSECTIIAYRDSDPPLASHWQVRTKSGDRFWALDFEVSDL